MIKPIETRFRGRLFRSRIEARWAVFFESLNLPWLYETEGYETPSGFYLPDFWLPRCPFCGEYGIEFNGRAERIGCCPEAGKRHKTYTSDERTIAEAYGAARTRRFEHDENEQWQ